MLLGQKSVVPNLGDEFLAWTGITVDSAAVSFICPMSEAGMQSPPVARPPL